MTISEATGKLNTALPAGYYGTVERHPCYFSAVILEDRRGGCGWAQIDDDAECAVDAVIADFNSRPGAATDEPEERIYVSLDHAGVATCRGGARSPEEATEIFAYLGAEVARVVTLEEYAATHPRRTSWRYPSMTYDAILDG